MGVNTWYIIACKVTTMTPAASGACPEVCRRMAMRRGNPGTLSFLLGDHLGRTSLTASSTGSKVAELPTPVL